MSESMPKALESHPFQGRKVYLYCGNKTGVGPDWFGVDIRPLPGVDLVADVLTTRSVRGATEVLATPRCDGFTDLPWRPATGEGRDLLIHCLHLCEESGAPWLLENNRWAQAIIGKAACHRGGHYFWGPLADLLPVFTSRKMHKTGADPLARAALPRLLP